MQQEFIPYYRKCRKAGCTTCEQGQGHYYFSYGSEDGKIQYEEPTAAQKERKTPHATITGERHETKTDATFGHAQWLEVKAEYDDTCLCCGKREPDIKLVADHVVPTARGGENIRENIQPLCVSCNARKGVKTIDYRQRWRRAHGASEVA